LAGGTASARASGAPVERPGEHTPPQSDRLSIRDILVSSDGGESLAFGVDRCGEGVDVVGAVVPLSVNEEGGSAGDAAEIGRFDVLGDAGGVGTDIEVIAEAGGVEIQPLGIAQQVVAG
jgi:hypothetical protein